MPLLRRFFVGLAWLTVGEFVWWLRVEFAFARLADRINDGNIHLSGWSVTALNALSLLLRPVGTVIVAIVLAMLAMRGKLPGTSRPHQRRREGFPVEPKRP